MPDPDQKKKLYNLIAYFSAKPETPQSLFSMGSYYKKLGMNEKNDTSNLSKALECFKKAFDLSKNNPALENPLYKLSIAQVYYELNNPNEAAFELQEAMEQMTPKYDILVSQIKELDKKLESYLPKKLSLSQ